MKSVSLFFLTVYLVTLTYSCRNNEKGTLDYKTLSYDTNTVTIFKWDTIRHIFPDNSDPLPLTQADLVIIDSLFKDAVDSFNKTISPGLYLAFDRQVSQDSFVINRKRYKTQYFPYRDVNGQRIVNIIGFLDNFENWKSEVYFGKHHYGIRKLELKLNLSEKTRDNLHSGDYG